MCVYIYIHTPKNAILWHYICFNESNLTIAFIYSWGSQHNQGTLAYRMESSHSSTKYINKHCLSLFKMGLLNEGHVYLVSFKPIKTHWALNEGISAIYIQVSNL